jgi:hypothetical protein
MQSDLRPNLKAAEALGIRTIHVTREPEKALLALQSLLGFPIIPSKL